MRKLDQARARTAVMTGCSVATVDNLQRQYVDNCLTPKKRSRCGRKKVVMPVWSEAAVRTIITRMLLLPNISLYLVFKPKN